MGQEGISDGGKCFHDREAGESLLYLENSQGASGIGNQWVKEEVDGEWPLDFIPGEKGCHCRVLRSAVMGLALPSEGRAFWLLD